MRILHVEDDEDTRTLVAFILKAEGWEVVSVDNARAAIKLVAAGGFDLYYSTTGLIATFWFCTKSRS